MDVAERARLLDWLALSQAPGIGPRTIAGLLERFGDARGVRAAGAGTLRAAGIGDSAIAVIEEPPRGQIDQTLAWAERDAAHIVTRDDPRYPPLLAEIAAPPPLLYVQGDPALLSEPQIAVVGSRNPTRGGIETTREFAAYLAGLGLVVTSGMAAGIDAAAHGGALSNGRTIAVLGTGPDRVYPAAHRDLARRIAGSGALVSEFAPGTGPHASHFPRRNRIISALSLGTLVTEAAPKSGSLITARYAAEQGREVFAIPGSIHNPLARGCHALIRQGAKLIDSVDQLLEELAPQLQRFTLDTGGASDGADAPDAAAPALDEEYRRLLDCMGHDPLAPDELIARSGLPAQSVSSMLLLLELQGYVSSHPGGRYSRSGPFGAGG